MRLEHQFSVPAPPDAVWAAVIDPQRVAPCMPGATLTEVNGAEFSGGVKVKLGPVSLLYKGSGQFLETDEQARRVVIKAAGKDSRGNGTAAATVTVTLAEDGGATKGTVVTDLTITGKPAQFGRGMIAEVGGKILDTFATCLADKLGAAAESAEQPEPAPAKRRTRAKVTEPAPQDDADTADAATAADSDTTDAEEPPPQAKPKPATRRRTAAASKAAATKATSSGAAETASIPASTPAPPDPGAANGVVADVPAGHTLDTDPIPATPRLQLVAEPAAPRKIEPVETEPIDLLDYAGPSVAKRLIPVVVGLVVLILLIRRLRRS